MSTVYFVTRGGNDSNTGLSSAQAWRSLTRISQADLKPGDRVVLESGATFEGSLVLGKGGAPQNPVVIESLGAPAVIQSPGATGIHIKTGGITVRNLTLRGLQDAASSSSGIWMEASSSGQLSDVTLEKLDISGYGKEGISISGSLTAPYTNGFSNVKILSCKSHANYGNGFFIWDSLPGSGSRDSYAHRNLVVRDSEFSDNLGGNGVIVNGVEGALFEYCIASRNRRPKKVCLGMWTYCAKDVTFRYCIANGTRGDDDGNGFDLDGGSVNCKVLSCLTFDNDSAGYMHCDYPNSPKTIGNLIADSVSINDARNPNGRQYGFGFCLWGSGLFDCTIEGCTVIITKPTPKRPNLGGMWATFIRNEAVPLEAQPMKRCLFRNNTVQVDVEGPSHVWDNIPSTNRDLKFVGNRYIGTTMPQFYLELKGAERLGLQSWLRLTGEKATQARRHSLPDNLESLRPRDLPRWLQKFRFLPI